MTAVNPAALVQLVQSVLKRMSKSRCPLWEALSTQLFFFQKPPNLYSVERFGGHSCCGINRFLQSLISKIWINHSFLITVESNVRSLPPPKSC
ncbi:MAG: hypothetical protein CMM01_25230 [Rhodopirellula sp.]|nr:hypothetical protein [Rhodopirellula sp.]OUX49207.1 MAG: hypothetical protein CBE43_10860 [Rhodopirellula sp. TMED283]